MSARKSGQVSVRTIIVMIAVASIVGAITYSAVPRKTTAEDVRDYLKTASENEIKELLATIPADLLKEVAGEKFPMTIVDDLGRGVVISKPPNRIVSTSPSFTEILFALGLDNRVGGVTKYCNYPPRVNDLKERGVLEEIGGFSHLSVEKVVGQDPDLVLSSCGVQEEYVDKFEEMGLTVVAMEGDNLSDVISDIRKIGRITGVLSKANELADNMREEIKLVAKRTEGLSEGERPKVFWETWHDPLMTAGKRTFINEMIELAGGRNIFENVEERYFEVSKETVIERDPEVYFISAHAKVTKEQVKQVPGYEALEAVKENRVYETPPDIFSRAGPRLIDALKLIAYYLHPGLFKKPELPYAENF